MYFDIVLVSCYLSTLPFKLVWISNIMYTEKWKVQMRLLYSYSVCCMYMYVYMYLHMLTVVHISYPSVGFSF